VTLFAVVLDFSEPFVQSQGEMKMKLKVIDESFNRMNSSFGEGNLMNSVVHLSFYNKENKIEEMPSVVSVGDIIYVRRFKFHLEEKTEKVIGQEMSFSNWMVLNLETLAIQSQKVLKKQNQRELYKLEEMRAKELQAWAKKFFAANMI
jgi:hypothetical protein